MWKIPQVFIQWLVLKIHTVCIVMWGEAEELIWSFEYAAFCHSSHTKLSSHPVGRIYCVVSEYRSPWSLLSVTKTSALENIKPIIKCGYLQKLWLLCYRQFVNRRHCWQHFLLFFVVCFVFKILAFKWARQCFGGCFFAERITVGHLFQQHASITCSIFSLIHPHFAKFHLVFFQTEGIIIRILPDGFSGWC